jgi:hypothetical protein
MPITNRNTKVLHKREPQMMSLTPVSLASNGRFIVTDPKGLADDALHLESASSAWLYSFAADSWMPTASPGFTSFGAGADGYRSPWSNTYTATGGSTTTITMSSTQIRNVAIGATVEFLTGANAGVRTTVSNLFVDNTATTIIVPTLSNAVANTDTFRMNTGRYFVWSGGAGTNGLRSFDVATGTWSSALSTSGPTASWGTDGRIEGVFIWGDTYASGTATAGTSNTLTNSTKSWTTNQWANFQVRITAGTGRGQIRVISSNTGTALTTSTNWTTTPDATSEYVIEGDEDKIYLSGNSATAFFRYSISANTWTTLSPTQALTTVRSNGMSLLFTSKTGDADYSTESVNRDGRYIYSHAGAGSSNISRYDIAANTWVVNIPFSVSTGVQTYTSGSSSAANGRYIYITKDSTGRVDIYDVVAQTAEPYMNINYINTSTTVGNRMFYKSVDSSRSAEFLYIGQAAQFLFRQLMY